MGGLLPRAADAHPSAVFFGRSIALGAAGMALFFLGRASKKPKTSTNASDERFRLCKMAVRMLSEPLPATAPDAAYLFGQLNCNLDSMKVAAMQLVSKYPNIRLVIVDVRNDELEYPIPNGFGGGPMYLATLYSSGISQSMIELVAFDHATIPMIHTLVESELVVRHAKVQGWRSLLAVAPPFHLPRAAMTMASVCAREYPELDVIPFAGAPLPWDEPAVHSQGVLGTRAEFLDGELERIERYTAKGDIAPWAQLEERFRRARS